MKTQKSQKNLKDMLLECLNSKGCLESMPCQREANPQNFQGAKGVVVVCFGTPAVSGDAFGPLVADCLRDELSAPIFVYGTTDNPITAANMSEKLDFVRAVHKDDVIVAVDASLGDGAGKVVVRKDGVCPAAVKGRKKRFGDVGVLGVVGSVSEDPMLSLMSVDFSFVESLAKKTAAAICSALT